MLGVRHPRYSRLSLLAHVIQLEALEGVEREKMLDQSNFSGVWPPILKCNKIIKKKEINPLFDGHLYFLV